jgi:hypothetical protein
VKQNYPVKTFHYFHSKIFIQNKNLPTTVFIFTIIQFSLTKIDLYDMHCLNNPQQIAAANGQPNSPAACVDPEGAIYRCQQNSMYFIK